MATQQDRMKDKTYSKTRRTNKEIAREFVSARADSHSKPINDRASHMAITAIGDDDNILLLWGYDWALYGIHSLSTGILYVYDQWSDYSSTTAQHMGKLRRAAGSDDAPEHVEIVESGQPAVGFGKFKTERTELKGLGIDETDTAEGYSGVSR